MIEIVVIFECIDLGEEELVVAGRAVPCGEVWLQDAHCRRLMTCKVGD